MRVRVQAPWGGGLRGRGALAFAAMVLLVAVTPVAAGADPLVAQWPLDAATTAGGHDTTGDAGPNHLDLQAAAGTLQFDSAFAKFGGHLSSTSTSISQVVSPLLAPAQLTLLAWIKQSGDPGTLRYIAGRGDDGPTCSGSSYALYTGYPGHGGLFFYLRTTDPGAPSVLSDSAPASVFDGNWHLLAGTYDGTNMRFFVDGVPVGDPKPAPGIGYGAPMTGQNFYVDGYPPSAGCFGIADFPGQVDEVRVYDRALTQTELGRLASAPGPVPPVLEPDTPPDTGGGGSTGGGGTGGGTGGGATAARAEFTVARDVAQRATVLDASQTTGADRLDWDLNNDQKNDVSCPASQPYLGLSVQRSATQTIALTALGGIAGGLRAHTRATGALTTRSSFTSSVAVTGMDIKKQLAPYAPPDTAVCSASRISLDHGTADDAVLCTNQTLIWGLMSVQGCYRERSDESDVPAGERALIKAHYEDAKVPLLVKTLCNLAARGSASQDDCVKARAMFKDLPYDVFVAKGTVDLNGIKITPRNGASVAIFPKLQRLVSSDAKVTWGAMTVRTGQLDLNFANDENESHIHFTHQGSKDCVCGLSSAIARYDGARDLPDIAGFKLNGQVVLQLAGIDGQRYASGAMQLQLPADFGVFGGAPPSAGVRVLTQNGTGLQLDHLLVSVPEASFGPVRFTDVKFRFERGGRIDGDTDPNSTCPRNEWKAQANILFDSSSGRTSGFRLTPPPAQNGLGFCDGAFRHAGGAFTFPDPRPEIFPGVFLDAINFALALHPTLVRGGGTVSMGDVASIDGTLLMAFASPSERYTLTRGDAGAELALFAGRVFDSATVVGGGAVSMNFPGVGKIPVGSGAVLYSYPDHVAAAGEVRIVVPGMAIYGHAGIETRLNQGVFTSSIGGSACLAGVRKGVCIGGDGWVTSKGIVACLNILDTLHPGAGLNWQTRKLTIWPIDGCKPSRYWVTFSRRALARAAAAGAAVTFTVQKGETVKNVRIPGSGGAPAVRVTAPGGETLDVSGDDWTRSAHLGGVRDQDQNITYVGVKDGPVGTYTVTPLPGSAPLSRMEATRPGYDSHFTASVSASQPRPRAAASRVVHAGEHVVLRYDARKRGGGQQVTFAERSSSGLHPIKTATGGRGTVSFTPAPGGPEQREIVVLASVDGTPLPTQTLATFRYAGTPRATPPQRVRVRRRGTRVTVSWTPVAGARRYGVLLRLGVGSERQLKAPAGRRTLTIAHVPLSEHGTVRVSAEDALGRWSAPRTSSRFPATRAFVTLQQTARHNERRSR